MKAVRSKQTGFGIIEAVIIIAAVGIIGVAGWFVYQHDHTKVTNTAASTTQQKTTTVTQINADPYAGWQSYCDTTVKTCIKYPSDWVASPYGGLENPACTEYAALTGSTVKDRGSSTAYIASIDDLKTPMADLKILGTVVDNKPEYSVYNTSYISENNLHVGATQEIAYANYTFTGKTGDASVVGTPCANGYAAISTAEQAKAWFNTAEGKTVLKVVQSFSYQQ